MKDKHSSISVQRHNGFLIRLATPMLLVAGMAIGLSQPAKANPNDMECPPSKGYYVSPTAHAGDR